MDHEQLPSKMPSFLYKVWMELDVVVHTFSPSTLEADRWTSEFRASPASQGSTEEPCATVLHLSLPAGKSAGVVL